MRVALVSDMHGNAVALRAVLADIQRHDVDLIVSLGDVAQGGPQPLECVELLHELGGPCIFGNADDFLLTLKAGRLVENEQREAEMRETALWSREQLGVQGPRFLRDFVPTVELDLDGTRLACCHATPSSNEDVILPDTPRPDAERMIGDVDAEAIAAGHVHLQWLRRFGRRLWFCVGSVGLVYEHKDPLDAVPFEPWSEYGIATSDGEAVAVEFRRVPFDVEKLVSAARASDFPAIERWQAMWKR